MGAPTGSAAPGAAVPAVPAATAARPVARGRRVRAVFFDVDGTLLSFKIHGVPQSATEALRRLRENGILPILATGRAPYMLESIDMSAFAAHVLFNGQLCTTPERELVRRPLDRADVAAVVEQTLGQQLYPALFMEEHRCYLSERTERVERLERMVGQHFPVGDCRRALDNDVFQLNLYLPPEQEDLPKSVTRNATYTRWTDLFCDVMPSGGGKEQGVRLVLEQLGIDPGEAVAIGDGENDLGMFAAVGTSVAMGNSYGMVKEAADMVTDDVDHDGVLHACERLGLI